MSFKSIYNDFRRYKPIATSGEYIHRYSNKNNQWLPIDKKTEDDFTVYIRQDFPDNSIVGTADAFAKTIISYTYFRNVNIYKLYNWFKGRLTDGYMMTLLSMPILCYWLIISVALIPYYFYGFISFLFYGVLFFAAFLWELIFEFPAAWMNKEKLESYYIPDKNNKLRLNHPTK